jgi:Rrf2 family protein
MPRNTQFAFAVHAVTLMAWAGDVPVKSETIAMSVSTNPVVIRRILCDLARAEVVTSQVGVNGGFRLGKLPGAISLLDIYKAVQPTEAFCLHKQPPNRRCPVGKNIESVLQRVLEEANAAMQRVLADISIGDLLRDLRGEGTAPCTKRGSR